MFTQHDDSKSDHVEVEATEKSSVEQETGNASQERQQLLAEQERLVEEIQKITRVFHAEADQRIGDPEEFAQTCFSDLKSQAQNYQPESADALISNILEVANLVRWAKPSPPLRSLTRKLLVVFSDLAKETSFARDVDDLPESDWWLLTQEITAAHAAQWLPHAGLSPAEQTQLVKLLLAHDLTGRSRFLELPLPRYFHFLGPDGVAILQERIAASQLQVGAPLRLASALNLADMDAVLSEWGGEPQLPEEYWGLILRLMDWDLDDQVVLMCDRALALSPDPHLREQITEVRQEAERNVNGN